MYKSDSRGYTYQRQTFVKYMIKMKILLLCMVTSLVSVRATTYAQKVTLVVKEATLHDALDEIQKQTGYGFLYNSTLISKEQSISLTATNRDIKRVLADILHPRQLQLKIKHNTVFIRRQHADGNLPPTTLSTKPAQRIVQGTIKDTQGEPLSGVTVTLKGTSVASASDAEGRFSLSAEAGQTLVFSLLGYVSQE